MEPDFYTKRTQQLLLSGYPVHVDTVDCSAPKPLLFTGTGMKKSNFNIYKKDRHTSPVRRTTLLSQKAISSLSIKLSVILLRRPAPMASFTALLWYTPPLS